MEAQYWAGIATGLGWGAVAGLVVALVVALMLKRTDQPLEREPHVGHAPSNLVPARRTYGD